jgi:hypothetical protein
MSQTLIGILSRTIDIPSKSYQLAMTFSFRFVSGASFSLSVPDGATVHEVKNLIHSQFPNTDPTILKLVHRSLFLSDSSSFSSTGVTPDDCILVIWRSFLPSPFPPPDLPALTPGVPGAVPNDGPLQELIGMGFEQGVAMQALASTGGDVQRAVHFILHGAAGPSGPRSEGGSGIDLPDALLGATVVTKLQEEFSGVPSDIVFEVWDAVGRDEARARASLQQMFS